MTAYVVQKGVPLPPKERRSSRYGLSRASYPFASMERGDSFALAGGEDERKRVANAAHQYGGKHGMGFRVRQDVAGIWRCWRVV